MLGLEGFRGEMRQLTQNLSLFVVTYCHLMFLSISSRSDRSAYLAATIGPLKFFLQPPPYDSQRPRRKPRRSDKSDWLANDREGGQGLMTRYGFWSSLSLFFLFRVVWRERRAYTKK